MREEQRIERICHNLERLWKQHPDQRLGQLLENYVFPNLLVKKVNTLGEPTPNTPTLKVAWMFFQEDDETDKKIILNTDFQHPKICSSNDSNKSGV